MDRREAPVALTRVNPAIAGEDYASVVFNFASGATGLWDANRYDECNFIDRMLDGKPFETNGGQYLRTLAVQEAVYESASKNAVVSVGRV